MTDDKNTDVSMIRKKYNLLIILTTVIWFLILILHIYKFVDRIFFRNGSVIIILVISALISTAVMQMYMQKKRSSESGK